LRWTDVDGSLDPQCLPVGGQSAWGVVSGEHGGAGADAPVVLVAAAMDSLSLFHDT
jgi:hypothetical protein